jgi:uncharacterized repeat protein (TIGR01451 family)
VSGARAFVGALICWTTALPAAGPVSAQTVVVTDTVPGTFVDISTSGTALGLSDEGVVDVWPDFDLAQTLFSGGDGRVWISNNGALGFLMDGSFGAFYLNAPLPDPSLFGGAHGTPQALAVYWDDLDADTGDVYYATIGEVGSRVFIVQWQDRPHYPGNGVLDGDEVTFQAQIFENAMPGHAQFLYVDVDFLDPDLNEGASATIGYQSGGIANDVQWSYNQPGAVSAGTVLTLMDGTVACANKGDGNGDCHIDLNDYQEFEACLGGPGAPAGEACECYDFDDDEAVDLYDFGAFQSAFTGTDDTIPGCTP